MVNIVNVTPSSDLQQVINSCSNPSEYNQYDIILSAGTYNIINLATRDYVNLKGATNDRSLYWLKGERVNGAVDCANYSTINLTTTTILQNLKVTCKNMRYPYHNDGCAPNTVQNIINCHIEHLGNWLADGTGYSTEFVTAHANGCGTSSGMIVNIKDSHLIARNFGTPLYAHNAVNFSQPSHIKAENCILEQIDGFFTVFMDGGGLSGKNDLCTLINNTMVNGGMWSHLWDFEGYGNSYSYFFNSYGDIEHEYTGTEHYKYLLNSSGEDIKKGTPCVYDGDTEHIRAMISTDSVLNFAGIASQNITVNTSGYLNFTGQIVSNQIEVPNGLNVGDTLGIDPSNKGKFIKSNSNYILKYEKDFTNYIWGTFKIFSIIPTGSKNTSITPKEGGSWKGQSTTFIKINGNWKNVTDVKSKIGGSWKS